MSGDLSREHWIVPVRGLVPADPNGTVRAIARRDGTVSLDLICGQSQTGVWFDVGRAAQLCTGIWEAAGVAQRLTGSFGDEQPSPPDGSGDLPETWCAYSRRATPVRRGSARRGRRLALLSNGAAVDAARTLGLRLRRIREARGTSLEVVSGLAGMCSSTLHHVEHGRRELTLSEIVALARALKTDPTTLIILPIPAPPNDHTDTTRRTAQAHTP